RTSTRRSGCSSSRGSTRPERWSTTRRSDPTRWDNTSPSARRAQRRSSWMDPTMTGPRVSQTARTLREDDSGVAGVVGFILVFAALVTYAAYVAHNEVPRWGADAGRSWDASVGDTLTKLDRSAAAGLGTQASATATVPPAPKPRG